MMLLDNPSHLPEEKIDASLLLLLEAAGAAHSVDIVDGKIVGKNATILWQFLGLPTGANPSNRLLDWIHSDDRLNIEGTIEMVQDNSIPRVTTARFQAPNTQDGSCSTHVLVIPHNTEEYDDTTVRLYILPSSRNHTIKPATLQHHKLCNVGSLAAGVAHDLNNLFTSIISLTDTLHNKTEDPNIQRYVDLLEKTVDRASNLTDGLLAFLKEEPSDKGPINAIDCIEELGTLVAETLGEQITFTLDMPKKDHPIDISRTHLGQIFLNLVINARDAIGDTEGTIEVAAKYAPTSQPTSLLLSVGDTGPGMPPSQREKVFRPFYTTKGAMKGTGLGLTIVKTIVEEAQGEIRVQSEVGKGTVFQVFLPIHNE